jgi:putative methyltransferase (TIGR04325 family)
MTSKKDWFIWEGIFASFADAAGEDTVFEGNVWLDKAACRARLALERSHGSAIPPVAATTEYALPFVAALVAPSTRPLRILDFGGGMATSYVPLRAMLPLTRAIDFTIVENLAVCRAGQEIFSADKAVHFRSTMPGPPEQFDIVHFGSSLHYVEDWKATLNAAIVLRPQYILFADLPAAENRTFVTVQNYYGRRIPVHFWNLDEFTRHVQSEGYDLLLRSRYFGYYLERGAELPTSNFDDEHRLAYTSQLIFRRANDAARIPEAEP